MQIRTEMTGISPDLDMVRTGNSVAVELFYGLTGYYDEESGLYLWSGEAFCNIGGASDYLYQTEDRPMFLSFTAELTPGVFSIGEYTINDYDSGDYLHETFRVILFNTASTYSGNNGMDIVFGSNGDDAFFGNGGDDALEGADGEDTLNGGTGNDRMYGGLDDDLYYVNSAGDQVFEEQGGGGSDRIAANVSYRLAAGVAVEYMNTTNSAGTTAINLTGNAFSQSITGNAGNNQLSDGGYGGWDILRGLAGDDTYIVNNSGTQIIEIAGQGNADRVSASTSFVLAADDDIERMTTTSSAGTRSINLTGNALAQEIFGNAGMNRLNGGGGLDTLTGGLGADIFIFNTALGAGNVDRISDFNALDDTIRLENAIFLGLPTGTLAADAFRSNTTGLAADADDRIIYEQDTGNLFFDRDGVGGLAGVRFAVVSAGLGLSNADFVVI